MGKRILILINKDNNVYNFRKEMVLELLERGYDIYINSPYGKKIDFFTEKGAHFIPLSIDRRGTNVFADLKLIMDYFRILKEVKPDLVLTYTTKPSTYGGLVCRFLGIPYIINNAGMYREEDFNKVIWFVLKSLYRLSYSHASCLMYQNTYERDTLNKIISNRAHYRDIPGSGVNLNEFVYTEYPKDDTVITFNFVGRIVNIKGISEFLTCAERIKEKYSQTRFVIYGDYDDESFRERIESLIALGIVEYGGVKLDMKPCIANAHAVIHPSYYEGMTNVVLEHSAMGRPCIGSAIPGVQDGIDDGITGYTFPLKDLDEMVSTVEKFILRTHEEKVTMGKAARKKMEREFDRDIVTNIYLDEINKIIKA